jgi:predicted enzyme related to lactoylglutathione lyase
VPNPVFQFQMLSKQPDEAAKFYTQLFGWSVDANNPMNYRRVDTGTQEGIQGSIWPALPEAQNSVQLFVEVDGVAKYAGEATRLGARVLIPPTPLPEGESMAVLLDPQGMSFGIYRRKK